MMRIKNGYLLRRIADEWIVVPLGSASLDFDGLIRVNETGAFLWKILEIGSEREIMIDALLSEYDIDRRTAENDFDEFIEALVKNDILYDLDKGSMIHD